MPFINKICAILIYLAVFQNEIEVSGQNDGKMSDYIRKCCISGLRHARTGALCDKLDKGVLSIPALWLGLCHSTFGVCCSRQVDKQNCELGRLAALDGSRCDATQNATSYADCCRACQVGLAVKASEQNCQDPLFSYFSAIESYKVCCFDKFGSNLNNETENASNGIIVLHDDDDICGKVENLCEHICENTLDAYKCSCRAGFKLDANNVTCSPNAEETDEYAEVDSVEEKMDHDKKESTNEICPLGYEIDTLQNKCVDIDECSFKMHQCKTTQYCHNTHGGYHCLNVKEKNCQTGYRYIVELDKCEDINECNDTDSPCDASYECANIAGGYECKEPNYLSQTHKCEAGFELKDNRCVDIDECFDEQNICESNQICTNILGGYQCDCKLGFNKDVTTNKCVDINECSINNHNCLITQRCDNTIGSYICTRLQSCGTGYTLNAQSGNCDDDDECALKTHNCPWDYECYNTKGSFRCYKKTTPSTTVTPKVTTSMPLTTSASEHFSKFSNESSRVLNNPQTLTDQDTTSTSRLPCATGFYRNNFGACTDINECIVTKPCGLHQRCINTNGSFRCENLLACAAGYKSTPEGTFCIDIDECETGEHNCGANQICRNRNGGYVCACPIGHQVTRLTNGVNRCVDINECALDRNGPPVCPSNALCYNTIGSYYCECKSGFQKKQTNVIGEVRQSSFPQCYDVDECQVIPGLCQQKCVNFWGGYRCTCNSGYELSADNRTCNDIDECEIHKDYKLCQGFCVNTPGSYECSCPRGYVLASDKTCRDIDECETNDVCTGRSDICTNIRGSYKCYSIHCPYGYIRDPEQNNRCRQISNFCEGEDCYIKPSAYTYNFITFASKLMIPPVRTIFTLRGPMWCDDIDFDLKIVRIQGAPNIERASEVHFDTLKSNNQVNLMLKKALEGPQDIELEVSMTVFTNGMPRGKSVAKVFLYVSQYSF